jgi:glutaredoxin 3
MAGVTSVQNPKRVRLYTRRWCGYCFAARRLFEKLEVEFEEIQLDGRPDLRREISAEAGGWKTVPMIFAGDRFLGGFSEVADLHRRGKLEHIVGSTEDAAANGL